MFCILVVMIFSKNLENRFKFNIFMKILSGFLVPKQLMAIEAQINFESKWRIFEESSEYFCLDLFPI